MTATCLCVIFNHPYPANIDKLRTIYAGRFDFVRFIQPGLRSNDDDVFTVYRGSYAHGAYVVDCLDKLLDLPADRYVVIQDDVLLAPDIDQSGFNEALNIADDDAYIGGLMSSDPEDIAEWGFWPGTLWRLTNPRNLLSGTGVDSWASVKSLLPAPGAIAARVERLRVAAKTLVRTSATTSYPVNALPLFDGCSEEETRRFYETTFRNLAPAGEVTLDYPLVSAGPTADFYVLPRTDLSSFAHICGVLTAAGAFAEIAIGTAMAYGPARLRLAVDVGVASLWSTEPLALERVLSMMADDPALICVHPVKLSGFEGSIADAIARFNERKPDRSRRTVLERALDLAPDFEEPAYLLANPDVAAAGVEPAVHFVLHGWREGRALRP